MNVNGLRFRRYWRNGESDAKFLVLGDWLFAGIEWKKRRQSSVLGGMGQYRKGFTSIIDRNALTGFMVGRSEGAGEIEKKSHYCIIVQG